MNKTKGFKMDEEKLEEVNARISATGLESTEWLESLMALETLHNIRKNDPRIEEDLKDLEKHMNVIYSLFIRINQKAIEVVEETKADSDEKNERHAIEIEELNREITELKKEVAVLKRDNSLLAEYKDEARIETERIKKSADTLEQLNRHMAEDNNRLNIQLNELQKIADEYLELKKTIKTMEQNYQSKITEQNVVINQLNTELTEKRNLIDKQVDDSKRREEEYEKKLNEQRKEVELEYKEKLLEERMKIQEETAAKVSELNLQHSRSMLKLVQEVNDENKKSSDGANASIKE